MVKMWFLLLAFDVVENSNAEHEQDTVEKTKQYVRAH